MSRSAEKLNLVSQCWVDNFVFSFGYIFQSVQFSLYPHYVFFFFNYLVTVFAAELLNKVIDFQPINITNLPFLFLTVI